MVLIVNGVCILVLLVLVRPSVLLVVGACSLGNNHRLLGKPSIWEKLGILMMISLVLVKMGTMLVENTVCLVCCPVQLVPIRLHVLLWTVKMLYLGLI